MRINKINICNFRYSDPNTLSEGQLSENILSFLVPKRYLRKYKA